MTRFQLDDLEKVKPPHHHDHGDHDDHDDHEAGQSHGKAHDDHGAEKLQEKH